MEFDCIIHDAPYNPKVFDPAPGTPGMVRIRFDDVQSTKRPRSIEAMLHPRYARALRDALNAANLEDAPRPA